MRRFAGAGAGDGGGVGATPTLDLPPGLGEAMGGEWLPVADAAYDLSGPEHDVDVTGGPRCTYALCSSPRSGSTLLAEALTGVGAAVPIEYLDPTNTMAVLWRRWGCRDIEGYLAALHRRRTSSAGLFGLKVHWYQLAALAGHRGGRSHEVDLDRAAEALARVALRPAVVRVQREDRWRQALSWVRAEHTRCWFTPAGATPPPPPEVPDHEVEARLRRLDAEEAAWTALLAHVGVEPLVVTYEELCADRDGVVRAVARHVGCPEAGPVPPARLVRQSG